MMKFKKPLELTYQKDGREYLIYIFQGGAGNYEFKTIRAVTVAILYDDDGPEAEYRETHFGISACSVLDEYDANLGIIKAVGRAYSSYVRWRLGRLGAVVYRTSSDDKCDYSWMATLKAIETAKRIDDRNRGRRMAKIKDKLAYREGWGWIVENGFVTQGTTRHK